MGINFVVTSDYGKRWGTLHAGIDLVAYEGAPVSSIGDGVVIDSRISSSYGNVITIKHPNGIYSRYAHLSKRTVQTGDKVKKDKPLVLKVTQVTQQAPICISKQEGETTIKKEHRLILVNSYRFHQPNKRRVY